MFSVSAKHDCTVFKTKDCVFKHSFRSNMPSEFIVEKEANTIQNCFQKSPALRPDHFSFVAFDNLLAIHSDSKDPSVEVFVAKHLQQIDNKWIVLEVQEALKKMVDIVSTLFELHKLKLKCLDECGLPTSKAQHCFHAAPS